MTRSRRIKRDRVDPATRLARDLDLPASQIAQAEYGICDVANHSDGDQRHMVRSGAKRTVYRKTKIAKLYDAKIISLREAAACQWYANAHAMRYDTTGITARYGEGGGCRQTSFDHLPKTKAQEQAFWHFDTARQAIACPLLPMFERVVLYHRPLGRLTISFRTVARRLLDHVETTIGLDVT